jgi:hypothetical protein
MRPPEDRAAPMTAAPFVWRQDGRPDWGSMWTSFCDLALHGGPPHRGAAQALRGARPDGADAASDPAIVAEIRRGIWETTGLFSEPLTPGWIAVSCESRAMAEWLGAAIVLENVEARVEADRVLVPAGPRFRLEDEVKSVVTVVAKTHHYGAVHGGRAVRSHRPDETTQRYAFRCVACGLEFHASRPESAADLDATCPVDGAPLARQGLVTTRRRSASAGPLWIGLGGPAEAKTALIDALRRRYGRRRAIVTSPAAAADVTDHAVDLVLVDLGESGAVPDLVDAAIGILDASALAGALARDDRALDVWHLLVVSTAGRDLARLEGDTRRRRGEHPVVFVDLATVQGIDAIASWLERELSLGQWRERRA